MQSVLNAWIGKECAKQSKQLCGIPDNSFVIELQTRGPNNNHLQNMTTTNVDVSQAARATSSKLSATAVPLAIAQPQPITLPRMVQPCYDDNAPMYVANDVDPGTTSWRLTTPEPGATPAFVSHVSAAALQHSTAVAHHVATSHAASAAAYPADVCLRSVTGSLMQNCAKHSCNISGTNS